MKQEIENSVISELSLLISIIPFILIIDRTIRVNGLNISLIIYSGLACLICFFAILLIYNLKSYRFKYLNLLGLLCSNLGIIIWLFTMELVPIYILGILILFLASIPSVRSLRKDSIYHRHSMFAYFSQFLAVSFMCFATSFLTSIFFWDNTLIYIIIGINVLLFAANLFLIFKIHGDNSLNVQINEINVLVIVKYLVLSIVLFIIPVGFTIIFFLVVRGYLFYIPFEVNTVKIFCILILASISLLFSFLFKKPYPSEPHGKSTSSHDTSII